MCPCCNLGACVGLIFGACRDRGLQEMGDGGFQWRESGIGEGNVRRTEEGRRGEREGLTLFPMSCQLVFNFF